MCDIYNAFDEQKLQVEIEIREGQETLLRGIPVYFRAQNKTIYLFPHKEKIE